MPEPSPPIPSHAIVIAADGGLDHARAAGLTPAGPDRRSRLRFRGGLGLGEQHATIQRHPIDKNATDTELAVAFAAEDESGAGRHGGRQRRPARPHARRDRGARSARADERPARRVLVGWPVPPGRPRTGPGVDPDGHDPGTGTRISLLAMHGPCTGRHAVGDPMAARPGRARATRRSRSQQRRDRTRTFASSPMSTGIVTVFVPGPASRVAEPRHRHDRRAYALGSRLRRRQRSSPPRPPPWRVGDDSRTRRGSRSWRTTRSRPRAPLNDALAAVHRRHRHRRSSSDRRRHRDDAVEGGAHGGQPRRRRDVGRRQHVPVAGGRRGRVRRRTSRRARHDSRADLRQLVPGVRGDAGRLRRRLRQLRHRPGSSEHQLDPPADFDDLARPEYADLLVVENPATSSPGLAFLLATIADYGDDGWRDYWTALRTNGVRGRRRLDRGVLRAVLVGRWRRRPPLVVSYAVEPAGRGDLRRPAVAPMRRRRS